MADTMGYGFQTIGELTNKILQRLALVEGIDAQIYAEPRILLAIQHKFDLIFREYWLPEYTVYQEGPYTLDGITGHVVDDTGLSEFDWRDLHSAYLNDNPTPLPIVPMNVNERNVTVPSIRAAGASSDKWIKVLPVTTQGDIYITYRRKQYDFKEDSEVVRVEPQLIILGSCWDVLEDDGTNPGAADKFRVLFQDALSQFNRQQFHIPQSTRRTTTSVWNRWA